MKTTIIILVIEIAFFKVMGQTNIIAFKYDTIALRPTEKLIYKTGNELTGEVKYTDQTFIDIVKFENGYIVHWLTLFYNEKVYSEMNYSNGKPNGAYLRGNDEGKKVCEGYYLDGMPSGHWIFYYNNGKKESEGEFIPDTSQHGKEFNLLEKYVDAYGNATMLNENFESIPNGTWKFYNEREEIEKVFKFKNGVIISMEVGDRFKLE